MSQPMPDAEHHVEMSTHLRETLQRASRYASEQSHRFVTIEHILLALNEDPDSELMLQACSIDQGRLHADISNYLGMLEDRLAPGEQAQPVLDPEAARIINSAVIAAQKSRRGEVNGAIVLAAIIGDGRTPAANMLRTQGLTFQAAIEALQSAQAQSQPGHNGQPAPLPHMQQANGQRRIAPVPSPPVPSPPAPVPPANEAPAGMDQASPPHPAPETDYMASGRTGPDAEDAAGRGQLETAEDALASARRRIAEQRSNRAPAPPPAPANPPQPLQTDDTLARFERRPPPQVSAPQDAVPQASPPPPAPSPPPQEQAAPPPPPPRAPEATQPPPRAPEPTQPPPATYRQQGPGPGPEQQDNHSFGNEAFRRPPPPEAMRPPPPPAAPPQQPPQPAPAPPPAQPMAGQQGDSPFSRKAPPAEMDTRGYYPDYGQAASHAPNPTSNLPVPVQEPPPPQISTGKLIENIPRRMRVAVPEMVEIRIARSNLQNASAGMQGSGAPHQHDLVVTKAMSVRLRAPDGGFFIETASPETQWTENHLGVLSDDYASWRWAVTPKRAGKARLQLVVSARTMGSDGLMAETALPDQVFEVRVATNYGKVFARLATWIGAAIAGGLLAKFGEDILALGQLIVRNGLGG